VANPFPGLSHWGAAVQHAPDATTKAPATPSWPSIDGFEIRSRLGGDGQGDVYAARDQALQVEVAIKVPKSLTPAAQEQFLREARALARLEHANIVRIRSFGRDGHRVYFVMDVISGPNAAQLVRLFRQGKAHKRSSEEILRLASVDYPRMSAELRTAAEPARPYYRLVAEWMAQAADGLQAAHEAGIYHRDVKPSNFLMASDGRLMVADFGLARSSDDDSFSGGLGVTGTYPYIAPERALGEWARVDHRSDIWALGATLYEFLTYQRAYPRCGREVLKDIVSKEPAAPRRIISAVPQRLEEICLKAMRRDPEQRYQSAAEMAADLRAWAKVAPRPARRVGSGIVLGCMLACAIPLTTGRDARAWLSDTCVALCSRLLPVDAAAAPTLERIAISPDAIELVDRTTAVPLRITAQYADQQERLIAASACRFDFTGGLSPLDQKMLQAGMLSAAQDGQGRLQVSYGGCVAECRVSVRLHAPAGPVPAADTQPARAPRTAAENLPLPVPVAGTNRNAFPPAILLACNEDLNTEDDRPARAGGTVESTLRSVLTDNGFALKEPHLSPETWDERSALHQAEQAGAQFVVFCTAEARIIERVPPLEYVDYPVDRWGVQVQGRVFRRQADGSWIPQRIALQSTDREARPRSDLYSGNAVAELARLAALDAVRKLHDESGQWAARDSGRRN
jgi:tRNA A-37 threonylcarbamoyl transferase component Bud32